MSIDALKVLRDGIDQIIASAAAPPPAEPAAGEWLTIGKFAKRYGYSTRTVSRWVNDFSMPHVGKHRNCRINVAAAMAWLESGGARAAAKRMGHEAHGRTLQ